MNDDVLLNFLSKGLINVGGDDDKLEHLRQTAVDLAGVLEEAPAKACPFALVAFDPKIPTTDSTVIEVEDALRKRWQTYVNTFSDTPVTVFRAMLLDALTSACGQNDTVAAAFVASARNVLPFIEVGDEQDTLGTHRRRHRGECRGTLREGVGDAGLDLRTGHQAQASSNGQNPYCIEEGEHNQSQPEIHGCGGTSLRFARRKEQMETQGNPHWPQGNPHEWNYEFGRRTAQTVGDAITRAVEGLSVEGVDLPAFTTATIARDFRPSDQDVASCQHRFSRSSTPHEPAVVEGGTVLARVLESAIANFLQQTRPC